MRLKKVTPNHWTGRVGPYPVEVWWIDLDVYHAYLHTDPGHRRRFAGRTLEKMKAKLTDEWLSRRLWIIRNACPGCAWIVDMIREGEDASLPAVLMDWLEENGEVWRAEEIAREGRKAMVVWPEGWGFMAGRYVRRKS